MSVRTRHAHKQLLRDGWEKKAMRRLLAQRFPQGYTTVRGDVMTQVLPNPRVGFRRRKR